MQLLSGIIIDSDAQRLQELYILIIDFELGFGAERTYQGTFVGSLLALLAEADRGFENQENIVTTILDSGDHVGDLVGFGQRLVDRLSQLFHQFLEFLVHSSPDPVAVLEDCQ